MKVPNAVTQSRVAEHYGATKRAVVNAAKRDRWQEQVEELERTAHGFLFGSWAFSRCRVGAQ